MTQALVVGAGPAGLMAAEQIARAGYAVTVAEARPSPARKLLMAGKSGLNLTKDEDHAAFVRAYAEAADWLSPMLAEFGPADVQDWARALGQQVFTGSSGRVFPVAMKASPLLRAWLARLDGLGVTLKTRWRWTGFRGDALQFETPDGCTLAHPKVTVLALGGASWARLGSDGAWAAWLAGRGVGLAAFRPANMGFHVNWGPHMARHFGQPVKNIALVAGSQRERGEIVVTARGLEGGGIYAVSRALRDGAGLQLDLLPDLAHDAVLARLDRAKSSDTTANRLRKAGLSAVQAALVQEWGRPLPKGVAMARLLKALPVPLAAPFPMDEAISTAGGISRDSVTDDLQLRVVPGVFACGEMLDWEAPTGGYLLTACLASGRHAGCAAARYLARQGDTAGDPA